MKMFSFVNRGQEFENGYIGVDYRRVKITDKRLVPLKRLGLVNYEF